MQIEEFAVRLEQSIAAYDLLRHPFYQAWNCGKLSREDLCDYARDYYHHVKAFPRAISHFARRVGRTELRAVVLANLREEVGPRPCDSHTALWLSFAEGLGAAGVVGTAPSPKVKALMVFYEDIAREGTPEQVWQLFTPTNRKSHASRKKSCAACANFTAPTTGLADTS